MTSKLAATICTVHISDQPEAVETPCFAVRECRKSSEQRTLNSYLKAMNKWLKYLAKIMGTWLKYVVKSNL